VSRSRPGLPRWAVVAAISGAGVFAAADAVLEHGAGVPWYLSIPDALVGWAYITGGVIAFRARQLGRTGTLMTAIGVIWNLDNVAQYVHAFLPYVVWLGGLVDPLLAQLLLSYPSRALRSRLERAVLAAAYLQVLVVNGVRAVFVNLRDYYPCPCVHSFPTVRNPAVFNALETEVKIAYVIIGTAVLALVFRRWRRASGPARRALNPLWFAGLATMTALILDAALGFARLTPVQNNAEAAVVTVVRPSLTVCYWEPETRSFVGADGRPADPRPPPGRAATEVTADGAPLAVLVHDSELLDQRPLLDAVAAAARLALENARLQAALAAQLEEVRASRARIVQAGLEERRKVERDLHDGAQQRLLALSLTIAMLSDQLAADPGTGPDLARLAGTARDEINAAIGELRKLGRGLHPAVLTNEGLAAAVETLVALAPLPVTIQIAPARYPPAVEATAYFVISEALANVARHARASKAEVIACGDGTRLAVEVGDDGIGGAPARGGSGLTGLADRVAALGGRLTITSPAGGGTTIRAELPCD
jgi:signal transduction histidine kinase